jgi:probable F420-dependent oxidoreductase
MAAGPVAVEHWHHRAGQQTGSAVSRAIRIAVQLQPEHAEYADIRRAVAAAEEAGVDIVFNWDHFFPLHGDSNGKHFECWTMLGAWAEATSRVEIGALVTCNTYRNPDLLADMARTVDHISGGRLILGLGAGWFEKDYSEYGYEFGTAGSRLAQLEESLARIEARWAKLNPPPTRKIPILIGGGGEKKTLRYTARHADIWHGFGDPTTLAGKHQVLDQWCATEGRDPQQIERAGEASVGPDRIGAALIANGTTLITIGIPGPHYDLALVKEWVAWRDEQNAGRPDPPG